MSIAAKITLVTSFAVNLLAAAAFVRSTSARGGLPYLHYCIERYVKQSIPDPYKKARETIFQMSSHPRQGAVVFLGDSLTDWNEWPEFFSQPGRILNRGISGQTSAGVLKNAAQIAALRPAAVFLMIGGNDAIADLSSENTIRNIREIAATFRRVSPFTHFYVQSLVPFRMHDRRAWMREVNSGLKNLADNETVFFAEVHDQLADQEGYLDSAYTVDGVHLNAAGYARWLSVIRASVEVELSRPLGKQQHSLAATAAPQS